MVQDYVREFQGLRMKASDKRLEKKRLCLVTATPLTVRFFLQEQIKTLSDVYEVSVVTNTDDVNFLAHLNVPVRVIPVAIERHVSLWRDFLALLTLVSLFRRERFDLVHSHSPKAGLLTMLAAWVAQVPYRIHTFQGEVWVTRKGLWRWFLKSLDKVVAKCSTHPLVVSQSENRFLIEQGVVQPGELTMLANGSVCGVDLERFRPCPDNRLQMRAKLGVEKDQIVILYMGRLNGDKGVIDLVHAFSLLGDAFPELRLLLVGPDEEDVQQLVAKQYAGLMPRITFVDYTPQPERYMAAADLLCLPSYREGFGLVLLEAASMGLPTIGSRIYGITDAVIESETGLLFEAGDVNDLASKLRILIEDADMRERFGRQGQERVHRDFSKEMVISALLAYYGHLFKQ